MTSTPTRVGVTLSFMRWVLALPLLVALFLISFVLAFNAGIFQGRIAAAVQSSVGGAVTLGPVRLAWSWPPRMTVDASRIQMQGMAFSFQSVTVDALKLSKPYHLRIHAVAPEVTVNDLATNLTPKVKTPVSMSSPGPAFKPPPLRLELIVDGGALRMQNLQMQNLRLKFEQKLLLSSPARMEAEAMLVSPFFPGQFPVTFSSDALTVGMDTIKAVGLKATVAGLEATVQGASLFKESRHRWSLNVNAQDLSRLPRPPKDIPVSNWRGRVQVKAEILKSTPTQGWEVDGEVIAHDLHADVNWSEPRYAFNGPLSANLEGQFSYRDNQLHSVTVKGDIDGSAARVVVHNLLNKRPQTPLVIRVDGIGAGDKLKVAALDVTLAQVHGSVSGHLGMQRPWPGELTLKVPRTPLPGLEEMIVPLAKSPLAGEIALDLKYIGPLADPWASRVLIEQLRLKSFSGLADYDGPRLKIRGPIKATAEISGEVDKGVPKRVAARGDADLKAAALVLGPLRKEAGRDLTVRFKAENAGESFDLENLEFDTFFGKIQVGGQVNSLAQMHMDVRMGMRPLNLTELRIAMPEFRDMIPKGELAGQLRLNGKIQTEKPWHDWPLQITGDIAAKWPEYKTVAAETGDKAQKAASAPLPPPPPTSFLPKGALTERLNLKVKAEVGKFENAGLVAKNIASQGRVLDGRYSGSVAIGELFSGRVELTSLDVPLLVVRPMVQGAAKWQKLTVEDVLAFMKPEYKTFAVGKTDGRVDFATTLPSDEQFLARLKVSGESDLDPITFNTIKVGEMMNEMVRKLPVKIPPAKVEPLKGSMKAQFDLSSQTLNISALEGRDLDGSELKLKGKVAIPTLHGDLVGSFAWAQAPLKGCILEGNADDQGRLVVPLAIQGDLMKPGVSLLRDVAGKLAAKALACEGGKLVDKVKRDGGKAVEKEAKKLLEGILGK